MTTMQRVINLFKSLFVPRNWQAVGVFTPGIIVVAMLVIVFWNLEQGKDTVRQSLEDPVRTLGHGLGLLFLGSVTWYGSRMVGFAHWKVVGVVPFIRNYGPRFLGFSCFTAVLVAIALSGGWLVGKQKLMWLMVIMGGSVAVFATAQVVAKGLAEHVTVRATARWWYFGLIAGLLLMVALSAPVGPHLAVQSVLVLCMQVLFTLFVCMRTDLLKLMHPKPLPWKDGVPPPKEGFLEKTFPRERGLKSLGHHPELLPYDIEYWHYKLFFFLSVSVLVVYMLLAGLVSWSQCAGAFAVVLLGGAIIMGALNAMRVVRAKLSVSIAFILFIGMFISGRCFDHHQVHLIPASPEAQAMGPSNRALRTYLAAWLQNHVAPDTATMAQVPVYMVLADGGASRSGYWVAQALARISEGTGSLFHGRLLCLSGASGGSVGVGTYHALLSARPSGDMVGMKRDARMILGNDFLAPTLSTMLCTDVVNELAPLFNDRARTLEKSMEFAAAPLSDLFVVGMKHLRATNDGSLPILCLNTVRMQDGRPAYSSNVALDEPEFNARVDVPGLLPDTLDIRQSSAMVLSSRFPYISPAGRIDHQRAGDTTKGEPLVVPLVSYFVDGGYFDNSGAGVVDELISAMGTLLDSDDPAFAPYRNRIAYNVIHISNTEPGTAALTRVHPMLNDAAAPLLTVAGTYASQTDVNNARLRRRLSGSVGSHYCEVNLYESEKGKPDLKPMSMNWVISKATRHRMDHITDTHYRLDSLIGAINLQH